MDGMDGTFCHFCQDADLSNLQVFLDSENADSLLMENGHCQLANESQNWFSLFRRRQANSIYYVRFEIKDDLRSLNNEAFGHVVTENGKYLGGSVLKLQAEVSMRKPGFWLFEVTNNRYF